MKSCHNKNFVTVSVVTITEKDCNRFRNVSPFMYSSPFEGSPARSLMTPNSTFSANSTAGAGNGIASPLFLNRMTRIASTSTPSKGSGEFSPLSTIFVFDE